MRPARASITLRTPAVAFPHSRPFPQWSVFGETVLVKQGSPFASWTGELEPSGFVGPGSPDPRPRPHERDPEIRSRQSK